jgi:hypothetical protein
MGKLGLITLIIAIILRGWLAVLLVRRRIQSLFPMFLAYVVFSLGASIAELCVYSNYRAYYFVYWGDAAVLVVLATLALLEVFRWVFALFWMSWWYRGFLYGAMLLALGLAIANAVLNPPANMHPIGALIYSSGIAVNFMQLTIFAVFWLLSKRLLIGFRRYAFGIMLGFGMSSFGTLFAGLLRSVFGTKFTIVSAYIPPVAYICALGFWLHVFWRKEPPEAEGSLPLTPEELAEQMRQYTEMLKTFLMKR